MPHFETSPEIWQQINAQRDQFNFPTHDDLLQFCLEAAKTRYWLAVSAIITRDNREVLMVGNDYGRAELVWNLPGGAVDPGEDLLQAVARELHEETGITALEIGPLAWVVQGILKNEQPFIIAFAFEITAWEGEVSVANEVVHGDVQQAEFVPFAAAVERMIPGNQAAFRDWLADAENIPRIYLTRPQGTQRIK